MPHFHSAYRNDCSQDFISRRLLLVIKPQTLQFQFSLLDFIVVLLPLYHNESNYGNWRDIKYIFSVNSSCHGRRDTFWGWYLLKSSVVNWITQAELRGAGSFLVHFICHQILYFWSKFAIFISNTILFRTPTSEILITIN